MIDADTRAPRLPDDLIARLLEGASVGPSAATMTVRAPFDGKPLFELPLSDEADVDAAVLSLRAGQRAWGVRPVEERCRIILRFHDLVLERREEGLDVVQWETGKARRDAMEELLDVCLNARHYARSAPRLLRPRRHFGGLPLIIGVTQIQHPKGVVGVIAPWNYPLTLAAGDAIPALVAGNTVVIKPDPQTTLTALWVVDLLVEAGVPESAVRVVPGDGSVVGPMVVEQVDYVMFTGSTRVGRQIAARCGERLIGCSLELGGKNAMIVRADADVRRSAEIAVRACFSNAGQLCVSTERMYVHDRIYDDFIPAFLERTERLTMAARPGWEADMGSLISAAQRDRVLAHIADAVDKGAVVLAGGHARPDIGPFYVAPTVLTAVTSDMHLCREETFGPVVAVYRVGSDDEAVRAANDSEFGLNASVLTGDRSAGQTIARAIRAGTVNVNEAYGAAWASNRSPMGGMGSSGLGRRHGEEGLLKYTEPQTIATQRALGFGPQFGMSDRRWTDLVTVAVRAMRTAGLR